MEGDPRKNCRRRGVRSWRKLLASWDYVRQTWRDEKADKFEALLRDIEAPAKQLEALEQTHQDILDEMPE